MGDLPADPSRNPTERLVTAGDGSAPDLEACSREPIHIPGSIQPHGLLLVADAATARVVGVAGDVEGRLAAPWQGRALADLLGQDTTGLAAATATGGPVPLTPVRGLGERFEAVAHRVGERLLVELEPVVAAGGGGTPLSVLADLDAMGAAFERAADLTTLCERAVAAFRRLTGYSRVMIYRFLEDDVGEVVAEDADPGVPSFLHHHFPASDIPLQARALYVRNRVRVIPDIGYTPAPLRGTDTDLSGLDLSDVSLRSVSPVHIQYMRNMGVAASASVSIVSDGSLWGLVACHHWSPKPIPPETRSVCRVLAGGLARQIRAKENARLYHERLRMRTAEEEIVAPLAASVDMARFLADAAEPLRAMLDGDGFAALHGDALHLAGNHPDPDVVRAVAGWVRDTVAGPVYETAALGDAFEAARPHSALASGLLAVVVQTDTPFLLLWFRAERMQVVEWAGNPHKAATVGPAGVLTPRASFDAWRETVRGKARPWSLVEVEAARRLARTLTEIWQTQRIRTLNDRLSATNAANEQLLRQKECLIGEVNHRVRNSLQMVSAFLGMQAQLSKEQAVIHNLQEAQSRVSAISLVHKRLYVDEHVEIVDLGRYLEDICADMRSSLGGEWESAFRLDLAPVLIATRSAANVGLILTELIINVSKYAYGGRAGPVTVRLEPLRDRFRLVVTDFGVGKSDAPKGFGSRMLDTLVRHIGGTMEEQDANPGLSTVVTAPVA